MLPKEKLKDLLLEPGFSRLQRLLLILAVDVNTPKSIRTIKELGKSGGLQAISNWNISDILRDSDGTAANTGTGWELTARGKRLIKSLGVETKDITIVKTTTSLRTQIKAIHNVNTVNFLNEAVSCLENKNYRAAVVLSWVGAISVLQNHVVDRYLPAFNTDASRVDSKWKPAKTTDDLSRMKESDFLNTLERLSILGKNVKQELEKSLILRNSCGHPNSLVIAEHNVAAHIETLILNVFTKF